MAKVGLAYWKNQDHLCTSITNTLETLGHQVLHFESSHPIPDEINLILTYGPFGSLAPLGKQLINYPASQRPRFALWMTEQFSNPAMPELLHYPLSLTRSYIERLSYIPTEQGEWIADQRLSWLTSKAFRLRYFGDLHWLKKNGVLSVLAVGSQWIAEFLGKRGFDPITAYIGSHPDWWADLSLERDISVLWLGKIATDRRRDLLNRIRTDLKIYGIDLMVVDGVENPYFFDEQRTILLNRTKIVLNLLREKWDNHSLRYFLAAANQCLIVTEPTFPHTPFTPGQHIISAPVENIASEINYYLNHEADRNIIVECAYQLATTELTMEKAILCILDKLIID